MKERHHELYIRWAQSKQARVAVGEGIIQQTYYVPIDILCYRSTVFNAVLAKQGQFKVLEIEALLTTSNRTFDAFFLWIMAPEPRLEKVDTLEEIVLLATMADHLGVWALSNQALELIETQVRSGVWKWSPTAVGIIYDRLAEGRPLRRLFVQTGLESINDRSNKFPDEEDEEEEQRWDALFLSHAELGCDYRRAVKEKVNGRSCWTVSHSPCEYHEHPWVAASKMGQSDTYEGLCAFAEDDCYPRWTWLTRDAARNNETVEEAVDDGKEPVAEAKAKPEAAEQPVAEAEAGATAEEEPAAEAEAEPAAGAVVEDIPVETPVPTVEEVTAKIDRMGKQDRKRLLVQLKRRPKWMDNDEEEGSDGWVKP